MDISSLEQLKSIPDKKLLEHYHFRLKSGDLKNRNDIAIMLALHTRLKTLSSGK
jgi:hypothetical protein